MPREGGRPVQPVLGALLLLLLLRNVPMRQRQRQHCAVVAAHERCQRCQCYRCRRAEQCDFTAQRLYLLKLLRHQSLPDAQLSVIANAVIISRLLYTLLAWEGFFSVELVNRINAFYDVRSVSAISSVISL